MFRCDACDGERSSIEVQFQTVFELLNYRFTSLFVLFSVAIKTNLAQLRSLESANFHQIMSISRISVRSVCSVTDWPSITGIDVILSSLRRTPGEQTETVSQMEIEFCLHPHICTHIWHIALKTLERNNKINRKP